MFTACHSHVWIFIIFQKNMLVTCHTRRVLLFRRKWYPEYICIHRYYPLIRSACIQYGSRCYYECGVCSIMINTNLYSVLSWRSPTQYLMTDPRCHLILQISPKGIHYIESKLDITSTTYWYIKYNSSWQNNDNQCFRTFADTVSFPEWAR